MDSITSRYCPVGTRDELHEEIKGLHKSRSMTVAEYATKFEDLISLERWILPDDGTAMSQAGQCRHFSAGMPRHWQMQVVPQQERWTDRRLLQERYLQCERVDQRPNKEPFEKGKKHAQGKTRRNDKQFFCVEKQKSSKQEKSKRDAPTNKRARGGSDGCKFCKNHGNTWKNHEDDDCFRNPVSPRYRPRATPNRGTANKRQTNSGTKSRWSSETAAMTQQSREDTDPISYWQGADDQLEEAAAVQAPPESKPAMPSMRTTITLMNPLSKRSFTALLDTGTTKSLVATEVVSCYTPQNQQRWFRNVNWELQPAMGTINVPFTLPDFSGNRQCAQEFMVVDKLLHPVIIGTDFMNEQALILDFETKEVRWKGLQIPMTDKQDPPRRVAFAVQNADDRTMRILGVTGKEIDLAALVPKENLTKEEQDRMLEILKSFRVAFLGGIGKLKLKPYVLPVKKGSTPKSVATIFYSPCSARRNIKRGRKTRQTGRIGT
ncbi:hypothetical protein PR003_g21744 [Phytophthora rubi]|uniref:Retrotransposon gag domain-containing protein n=1 Tax=Phytophthora rubi TaxID=129364 RepID=A0A6A3JMP7_9STRA|nr:hypothetical protein PR001_g20606 [Phytophthora rubi]KAE9304461.1 hypothetical protein PR003_g21744 [Phytophthora rubi]